MFPSVDRDKNSKRLYLGDRTLFFNSITRREFEATKTGLSNPEPDFHKNYVKPSLLITWIRWHGPYDNFEDWIEAAKTYDADAQIRLYMALGKKRWYRVFDAPEAQYVGLNARDSNNPLYKEITDKRDNHAKFFDGLFNEYWIGQLTTDWEKVPRALGGEDGCHVELVDIDTQYKGLTKNAESALIYALQPVQNDTGKATPPKFSFKIFNEICTEEKHSRRYMFRRFHKIVSGFVHFDSSSGLLKTYDFRLKERKAKSVSVGKN